MKKLRDITVWIAIVLFSLTVFSQGQINLNLYQDTKLLVSNDEYGNTAPTADLLFEWELQDTQKSWGFAGMSLLIEYADLSGGRFLRSGFGANFTFNKFMNKSIELSLSPNFTAINRWNNNFLVFGIDGTIAYKLNDNLRVATKLQVVQRADLDWKYNGTNIRYSGFVGIKYAIFTIDKVNYKRNRENKKYK